MTSWGGMAGRTVAVLALLALLGVVSCATGQGGRSGAAGPGPTGARDPLLRTGALPNGLRYYVRANGVPEKRAYLWLAVNAGSVLEEEDQRGYAHFLEHMAFNGTEHFPRQSLIDFVEFSGMRFGPDLNAYTSFDETVYQLTVPTDDPAYLERGLRILEDWAGGGITLDSAEVVAERGVVLGEWRSRALLDTASQRLFDHELDVLLGGTRYRERLPIGVPESIERANPEPLRRFYRDWYRPDLMAVIAVGDFDPEWMEREIRERFGGIPRRADARRRWEERSPARGAPVVDVLRDKVSPRLEVLWPVPERPREEVEAVRHELIAMLLGEYLQEELLRIREQPHRPFMDARLGRQRLVRPMEVLALRIVAWPDSLERALGVVLTELERVAQHGVPEPVLERRKAALLRRLEREAAGEAARPSGVWAEAFKRHYLLGEGTLLSAEQELELARELLPAITPEAMAEAAKFWRRREGLRVLVRLPQFAFGFHPPTRESVLAVFDSVAGLRLEPKSGSIAAVDAPLLERVPEPGRIVGERVHEASGVIEWTLSNGARVLFKPSWNHPDEVLLKAWSPGGFSVMPDSLFFSSGRMVGVILTEAAGVGERDRSSVLERLSLAAAKPLRVEVGYAHESIELGGSPKELELLFQLLHLQFTAPKLDSAALASWAAVAKYAWRGATIHDQFDQIFARGNPRLLPVTTDLAEIAHPEEVLAAHRDRFGNAGDFTFLVVGAASPEEVKPLVERYVASLPASEERETPKDPSVRPFVGQQRQWMEVNPVLRSDALLVFDGAFPTEPEAYFRERQRLGALALVLERRLRDRLREQLGGTYGVAVQARTYRLYDEHFRLLIFFQSAPERMLELTREMLAILDSVRESGATAAELETVARIQQRQLETALQKNEYWLDRLELHDRLGLPLDRIVAPYPAETLTPEELKEAAGKYLSKPGSILMVLMPRDTTWKHAGKQASADGTQRVTAAEAPAGAGLPGAGAEAALEADRAASGARAAEPPAGAGLAGRVGGGAARRSRRRVGVRGSRGVDLDRRWVAHADGMRGAAERPSRARAGAGWARLCRTRSPFRRADRAGRKGVIPHR